MTCKARTFAIAQVNGLGDVVCCLPLAAAIKAQQPDAEIVFIGRSYSRALIESSSRVDRYLDMDEVLARPQVLTDLGVEVFLNPYLSTPLGIAARHAGVRIRVGNWLRPESLLWANRCIAQKSRTVQRHRALLNLAYLRPLGFSTEYTSAQLNEMTALDRCSVLRPEIASLLDPQRFNLVLHPKSNNSAPEWPLAHFERLIDLLDGERVKVFITGSAKERAVLLSESSLLKRADVVDLTGKLELAQLIAFLKAADGLIAIGTGPLHIAAGVEIHTLGLFPGRARVTAVRWQPLGRRAEAISFRVRCKTRMDLCPESRAGRPCSCMSGISPEPVARKVLIWSGANARVGQ